MKVKLLAIAGSALFVIASNLAASANTVYDVSGGWLFPPASFSGTFDFTGSSPTWVDTAAITIEPGGALLNDVVSSHHIGGPFYSVTVNDGTAVGDYSLSFEFTLPTKYDGVALFATLTEVQQHEVCVGRGQDRTCSEQNKNVIVEGLGGGLVTADNVSATPLPATLPLFAGGFGLIGLIAGRRKRKSAGLAIA